MSYHTKTTAGKGKYYWDFDEFKYLVAVLKQVKDFKDILNLFIDIHTQKEIAEIIRRVLISSYLIEGKTYDEIQDITGCSRGTLVNINRKIMRQKAVIINAIETVGSFKDFKKDQIDDRDGLQRLIDNTLAKRDIFGLLTKRKRK